MQLREQLPAGATLAYVEGMDGMTLPPELERFAADAVAAGRYRDVSEVVAAGVSLLQRQEQARAALLASVVAAAEEADRDGYLTGNDMLAAVEARLSSRRIAPGDAAANLFAADHT